MALAHHRRDFGAADLAEDLRVGAGGLDYDDLGVHPVGSDQQMFRPHAHDHLAPFQRGRGRRRQQQAVRHPHLHAATACDQLALEEIHRRRADETGHEQIGRVVVELQRRTDLLGLSGVHDHDLVGHGHGLDLVVRDVNGGGGEPLVQLLDLGAHLHPKFCVQIGQRLVEQEYLRVAHDRAAHGHALALAAGELARVTLQVLHQPQDVRRDLDALAYFRAALAGQLHRECHVVEHGHVRVERVILEHHGDVALLRRHLVDHASADLDFAAGDFLQAGDHAQQRGLAAARRPDQYAEFPVGNRDVHAVHDTGGTEGLEYAFQVDGGHG